MKYGLNLLLYKACSIFREILTSRHLWLIQLQSLDQECAPDLPPHINIDTLSLQALRTLVVNAIRSNESISQGTVQYTRRASVATSSHIKNNCSISDARLSPGGQYLFVRWMNNKLGIFDLHDNNSCVWSYEEKESFENGLRFAFEMNADGTIIVLITVLK